MERLLLIKYGEIHLKGQNRPFFKRALKNRLIQGLKPLGCYVHEQDGRIYVTGYDPLDEDRVLERAKHTFGIVGVVPGLGGGKGAGGHVRGGRSPCWSGRDPGRETSPLR